MSLSVTTEATRGHLSNRLIAVVAATVLAVVLIGVVSVLTGGKVTSGGMTDGLPTTRFVGHQVQNFQASRDLTAARIERPWTDRSRQRLDFFRQLLRPCQGEMPEVAAYIREHGPSPIVVVGIDANDERSAGQAFVKKEGVTFPVAFDPNGLVTSGDLWLRRAARDRLCLTQTGVVEKVYFGAIPERVSSKSGITSLQ